MVTFLLLMTLCADQPAKAVTHDVEPIPQYIRRYFERVDDTWYTAQSELKKKLEEMTVKLQSAPADSRTDLVRERIQVEKALRGLSINQVRAWMPDNAEVGEIGHLNQGKVHAVLDKRTMAVTVVVGKEDRFEPQFGVKVIGGGGDKTRNAIIQRWTTAGYVAGKDIPQDEVFRVISTAADLGKLKLAFGNGSSTEGTWELERIPRGDVTKWRAQYDKEDVSLEKQELQPEKHEPLPDKKTEVAKLGAEPVELSMNLAKWRDQFVVIHNAHLDQLASALNVAREAQVEGKTATEKKVLARRVKARESELAMSKKTGPIYTIGYMPDQPSVGDFGFVTFVIAVDVIDGSSAVVKRVETLTFAGPERRGTRLAQYPSLITGVVTTDWPSGRAIEINGMFEASHVDKATRLVVLKPFDYTKWKTILEEQFGGFVSPRLESTDYKKWETILEEKTKNKAAK